MHPLVARIHPSFRTAFFAWVVARAAVWIGSNLRLGRVFPDLGVAAGTPLYRGLLEFAHHLDPMWGARGMAILGELALFVGVVAIYRFSRRDGMPQTADRAAWLWIASPAMVFALPGSDFALAYGLVAISMGAIMRPVWSSLALAAAVAIRPEAIVVWPAMAWGWCAYRQGDLGLRLIVSVLPAGAFAATVLGGLLVGEPQAFFTNSAAWRSDWAWQGFYQHADELIIAALLVGALAIALRMWRETPKSWLFVTLPVLALVAAHDPLVAGVAAIPFGVPLFVQTAKFAQDVGFERVLLSASLVALCLLSV